MGFEPCTIAHASKGRMRWNGGGKQAVWVHNIVKGENRPDHPCPKPFKLMRDLVRDFTDPGELIIDPFLGSGTTGVACATLGRRFVGIEIDEGFYEGACERIRKLYDDGLFNRPTAPMMQEALL